MCGRCFVTMAHMSPENQIHIPPSFVALFVAPGKLKPSQPWAHIAQRYEWCEDMAHMLVEPAREQMARLGITSSDVAHTCEKGLCQPDSVVSESEAGWVARRLDELLTSGL